MVHIGGMFMNLQEYIEKKYDNKFNWFEEETNRMYHQDRVDKVIQIKEYLSGKHKILNRSVEYWNGKPFYPKIIVLQYAKTILNFSTMYLLKNPVTLTGDEQNVQIIKDIYKKGRFHNIDFMLLENMLKFGTAYEYLYLDRDKKIKTKIINSEDSYPVYDENNQMIGFIEKWTTDEGISYYNVYYPEKVEQYNDEYGQLNFVNQFTNISGLPCIYKNKNEMDDTDGRSDLEEWINIIDSMEDLISKTHDSLFKYLNPLPIMKGQKLSIGENGEGAINPNIIGNVIYLDDDSDFDFASGKVDINSFEKLYKTLKQALLDISCTPAVSMNSQDVSNLAEVSIKLMFSLADLKAGLYEKYMKEGFYQRFKAIERILKAQGINFDADEIDVVFQYSRPSNDKDIVDILKALNDMNAISLQSIVENAPMINDVVQEMERIQGSNNKEVK